MKNQPLLRQFQQSNEAEPHRGRTKMLLEQHPELRRQIGRNRLSILVIFAGVGLQLLMSFLCRNSSWWLVVLEAYCIGAFISHALWVMIHESAHNLIFARSPLNTLAGILANLPHLLPSSVAFKTYHLQHHAFQGVYELDADIPSYWEARLVGSSAIGKAIWLSLFPLFQLTRPLRLKQIRMFNAWTSLNIVLQVLFDIAVYWKFGSGAILYLFLSFLFSVGLHPLGARWIQEHYMFDRKQETYSYYGPLNTLAFNVGYHNEHHDVPSVPWNRLPVVKEVAPEFYTGLSCHTSWSRLLIRFLFDKTVTLFSRQIRAA